MIGKDTDMEKAKIDRINELAHIAKERELTSEEFEERAALRKEYIEEFRRGTIELLENTYIQTPDGKSIPCPERSNKNQYKKERNTSCTSTMPSLSVQAMADNPPR